MNGTTSACWNFSEFLLHWKTYTWKESLNEWISSNSRAFLWGPAAVEHHKTRKTLGASLWKQVSADNLLALLNTDRMLQTVAHFPQQRKMMTQVSFYVLYTFQKSFSHKVLHFISKIIKLFIWSNDFLISISWIHGTENKCKMQFQFLVLFFISWIQRSQT